ncbi:Ankyrin repeat and ubiquitin domain-containing 1 [Intoshia linei]|uniref:Ankyrin repeat and ubiquitin domain-containing 1 n=1 Tax=Intoshia linei TaxID=1819745 RepID=A0A177B9W7_9BILA|nr:Ankyrin repeat and ubiquitin domain-containing 1 [Intoshia linei]
MHLFVTFKNKRITLNLKNEDCVADVKKIVRNAFAISPDENPLSVSHKFKSTILALKYMGATLEDDWIIPDLTMKSGTTLRTVLKKETKNLLYVHCVFNDSTVILHEQGNINDIPISKLKSIIIRKVGLPIGAFRICNNKGMEIFDTHTCDKYDIKIGETIVLHTWNGWNEFLNACVTGITSIVLANVSHDEHVARYQMRVALYMAAHYGHVDLALTLLKQVVRPDEMSGYHPLKLWSKPFETQHHIDYYRTPMHVAAEQGQLGVLRCFVNHNVIFVFARDGNNLTPLNIALRSQQRNTASFLLTKQWSKINYTKNTVIPLSIFTKMKRWCEEAREKVLTVYGHWKSSLKMNKRNLNISSIVGLNVLIDGYGESSMRSLNYVEKEKLKHQITHQNIEVKNYFRQNNQKKTEELSNNDSFNSFQTHSHIRSKLKSREDKTESQNKTEKNTIKSNSDKKLTEIKEENIDKESIRPSFSSKFGNTVLPKLNFKSTKSLKRFPSLKKSVRLEVKKFQKHTSMDCYDFAQKCVNVTNKFKEKPWIQQIKQAEDMIAIGIKNAIKRDVLFAKNV